MIKAALSPLKFLSTFALSILRDALVLVPLVAAASAYGAGLWLSYSFTTTGLQSLGPYLTTVATVLAALAVGLVFSAVLADPSDRFAPALRWLAVYLAIALLAACAGLLPQRSTTFLRQSFAIATGGTGASVIGLFLLVLRARGTRPSLEAWLEALKAAGMGRAEDEEDSG